MFRLVQNTQPGDIPRGSRSRKPPKRFRSHVELDIPTYIGNEEGVDEDYDETHRKKLYLYDESGLRICLGGKRMDQSAPDVLIERDPHCWRVFIHASGGDPEFIVEVYEGHVVVMGQAGKELHYQET